MKYAKKQLTSYLLIYFLFLLTCHCPEVHAQSGSADQLVKKAKDHLNLFQYDKALTYLDQAMQIDPDNWEPWFLVGKSYLKQKKEVQAEKYLQKAHELNPRELEIEKALGALYISFAKEAQNAGKISEMTDFLHKACKAYPAGTKIWQSLMENWWKNGEFEKIKNEGDFIVKNNSTILQQGDDKYIQSSLVIVAKAYYQAKDYVNTEKYLKSASMIRQHNDEMYSLKRELKIKTEENLKSLVDQANSFFNKGEYDKALELLNTANKLPGAKASDIADSIEKIEKESNLLKALNEIDSLISAQKFETALEKLEEISVGHPEENRVKSRIEKVSGKVDSIKAEKAKKRAAEIAEKKRQLDLKQKYDFFIKEAAEHEKNSNFDIAIMSLENALKLSPNQSSLKEKIQDLKNQSKAAKEKRDAYAVGKAELENLFSTGNFEECYTKGRKLLEDFPEESKELVVVHSETCLLLQKYDEAKKMILELEDDKQHQDLYNYIQGMISYNEGDRDAALENLKKISSGFRPDINSKIYWIYLYKFQAGIYIILFMLLFPAIRFAKEALANQKISSMLKKIEKIKETGSYEQNLGFLEERYEKNDTHNPKQVAVMLAEALLRSNNPQRAYEISSTLLKKDSRNANARRIAGEACLQLEDTSPMGLEYIQGLLKLDGSRKPVVKFLAQTYIKNQADHKMAQDFILESISLNPGDIDAVAYLAETYMKRQTFSQQSIKIFERAIKAFPDTPVYYQGIIENFRKIDNFDEAEKWLGAAREKFPDESIFSNSAGSVGSAGFSSRTPASGCLPDYESIGNKPAASIGGAIDYESIGNDDDIPSSSAIPGGFPDYESIGEPSEPSISDNIFSANTVDKASIQGPSKNCPHCNAINPAKEYYCTTCGKPFG